MVLFLSLLLRWRWPHPQLQKVVGVVLVHEACHSSTMVTDSLQVSTLTNIGFSFEKREEEEDINVVAINVVRNILTNVQVQRVKVIRLLCPPLCIQQSLRQ